MNNRNSPFKTSLVFNVSSNNKAIVFFVILAAMSTNKLTTVTGEYDTKVTGSDMTSFYTIFVSTSNGILSTTNINPLNESPFVITSMYLLSFYNVYS